VGGMINNNPNPPTSKELRKNLEKIFSLKHSFFFHGTTIEKAK
jgi:hypothetical protein